MNADYGYLVNLIKSNFIPVVLVVCTPEAEAICKKNNQTIIQLLWTYCFNFTTEQVRVRTVGEQPYDIRGFQVRFISLQDLERQCLPAQEQETHHTAYFSHLATKLSNEKVFGDMVPSVKEDFTKLQKTLSTVDPTPWFTQYRWSYIRSVGVNEVEFFEHPVAMLLVSSSDSDKVNDSFISLFDERNPPPMFRNGVVDPNVPKFYLLLHDNSSNIDVQVANKKFEQMKTTFEKSKCSMLRVNSLAQANNNSPTLMSDEDYNNLRAWTKDFIMKGIVPSLERSVALLHEHVETSRKGMKTTIKSWLGLGKKAQKDKAPSTAYFNSSVLDSSVNGPLMDPNAKITYHIASVESCEKRLADYLFMLQDYNEAFNLYKNTSKTFLNDKTWKFYAAALELGGLCAFLLDPYKKDLESYLDNSYMFYSRDNLNKFATRSTFFFAEILKYRKNAVEAAQKLIRAAERDIDKLCSAMLHEQSAFCFLNVAPPQFRKYTFRLVLAGNSYASVNQHKHAVRCFNSVRGIYNGKNWRPIEDHLRMSLSHHTYNIDNVDAAAQHVFQLLANNEQPPHKQATILRQFLYIHSKLKGLNAQTNISQIENENANAVDLLTDTTVVTSSSPSGVVLTAGMLSDLTDLPLPIILNDTLVVHLKDYPPNIPPVQPPPPQPVISITRSPSQTQLAQSQPIPRSSSQMQLQALVSSFLSPSSSQSQVTNQAPAQAHSSSHNMHIYQQQLSNEIWNDMEEVLRDDRGRNPKVKALLSRSKIKASTDKKTDPKLAVVGELLTVELQMANPLTIPLHLTDLQLIASLSVDTPNESSEASESFRVEPFDLLLMANETRKVQLSITPLEKGTLKITKIGFRLCGLIWGFREIQLPQKRLNETSHHRRNVQYQDNLDLTIRITHIMPLLDIQFANFPPTLLLGQVHKVDLILTNQGKSALTNVKLKYTNPAFFSFGEGICDPTDNSIARLGIENLNPQETITFPMWIRPNKVGNYYTHFLAYYEPTTSGTEMKYRLCRSIKHFKVTNSLRTTALTHLSYSSLNAYLLNLEVQNQGQTDFVLKEITAVSPAWSLQLLTKPNETKEETSEGSPSWDSFSIGLEESSNIFFRIVPVSSSQPKNPTTLLYHTTHTLHSLAQPGMDSEGIPFYDFLMREKHHLAEKSKKNNELGLTDNNNLLASNLNASNMNINMNITSDPTASTNDSGILDLVLFWETTIIDDNMNKIRVSGIHNVPNISFLTPTAVDKTLSTPSGSQKAATALRFTIESPRKVMHNFSDKGFCVVPVTFLVHNCSPAPISFWLETLKPHEELSTGQASGVGAVKRSHYFWGDSTKNYVANLKPEEKVPLTTCACFSAPGIYNLNRYRFHMEDEQQPIYSNYQHMIIIVDTQHDPSAAPLEINSSIDVTPQVS